MICCAGSVMMKDFFLCLQGSLEVVMNENIKGCCLAPVSA